MREGYDFMDMYWAGFKKDMLEVDNMQDDEENYTEMKINNYNENKFKFRYVPDYAE